MNKTILIKCDLCGNLFNPGELNDAYPYGSILICDECFEKESFNF